MYNANTHVNIGKVKIIIEKSVLKTLINDN